MTIRAGELDLVHRPAHRLDRGAVGLVLLAAAHEARGRERRGLGDPDHLEREELFHRTSAGSRRGERRTGRPARDQCRKWRRAREDHRQVVPVGDLDRHLVADRAARLDDRRDAGLAAAIWIPSGNGK